MEINPKASNACLNLGNILTQLLQPKEAEKYTKKAIEIEPDYADAHFNLGNILQSNLEYDKAISCYKKAIDLYEEGSQKSYKAIGELGKTLTYKGKYKEGLKKIKEGFGSILFDHKKSKMHIYSK